MTKLTKEDHTQAERNASRAAEIAEEMERVLHDPNSSLNKSYRSMIEDFDQGLPRATSPEVLNSACKW